MEHLEGNPEFPSQRIFAATRKPPQHAGDDLCEERRKVRSHFEEKSETTDSVLFFFSVPNAVYLPSIFLDVKLEKSLLDSVKWLPIDDTELTVLHIEAQQLPCAFSYSNSSANANSESFTKICPKDDRKEILGEARRRQLEKIGELESRQLIYKAAKKKRRKKRRDEEAVKHKIEAAAFNKVKECFDPSAVFDKDGNISISGILTYEPPVIAHAHDGLETMASGRTIVDYNDYIRIADLEDDPGSDVGELPQTVENISSKSGDCSNKPNESTERKEQTVEMPNLSIDQESPSIPSVDLLASPAKMEEIALPKTDAVLLAKSTESPKPSRRNSKPKEVASEGGRVTRSGRTVKTKPY